MSDSDLSISVALCTYNGERFLASQLDSIKQQTRLPDELLVCDDCSTDKTVGMLEEFACSAPFPVTINRNERNIGFVANFQQAILLCKGGLIALSDQDDIWYPQRLERSQEEFHLHPEVGLVFSDADVIDDQGRSTGIRLWQNFGFTGELKHRMASADYTVLVRNRFVTGATVMFRSRLREFCLPFGAGWLQDEWLAPTLAAVSEVRLIDEPLIQYRSHISQQVGLSPAPGFREKNERHWSELSRQTQLLEVICNHLSEQPLTGKGRMLLDCYADHLRFARFRSTLPARRFRRLLAMFTVASDYKILGSGVLSMATDLFLSK